MSYLVLGLGKAVLGYTRGTSFLVVISLLISIERNPKDNKCEVLLVFLNNHTVNMGGWSSISLCIYSYIWWIVIPNDIIDPR
jgi:hypothetical protein